MVEYLSKVAAIYPAAARFALVKMLSVVFDRRAPALLGGAAVKLTECLLSHFVRNWQKAISDTTDVQTHGASSTPGDQQVSESVRKHQAGLQSFRSMRRIEASRRNASALRLRFSQSLASLRQRLSQAKVRSTTQRRGSTTNPFVRSERLTISVSSCGKIFAKAF